MAIDVYLGLTAGEFRKVSPLPRKTAWMACHFSQNSDGLSNVPRSLPEGCLMILDDSAPIQGHDPDRIREELAALAEGHRCAAVLLDFQRPGAGEMVSVLSKGLPCPVAVSALYGMMTRGPVLLPPVPPFRLLWEHIGDWHGRELWLELSPEGSEVRLEEQGSHTEPWWPEGPLPFRHEALKCRYRTELLPGKAVFRGCRTAEDLEELLGEAERLGVTAALGLWAEFPGYA